MLSFGIVTGFLQESVTFRVTLKFVNAKYDHHKQDQAPFAPFFVPTTHLCKKNYSSSISDARWEVAITRGNLPRDLGETHPPLRDQEPKLDCDCFPRAKFVWKCEIKAIAEEGERGGEGRGGRSQIRLR